MGLHSEWGFEEKKAPVVLYYVLKQISKVDILYLLTDSDKINFM